jgi:hypothetical protein
VTFLFLFDTNNSYDVDAKTNFVDRSTGSTVGASNNSMNSYKQATGLLSGQAKKEAEDFIKKYPDPNNREESKSTYSSFGLGGKSN